MLIRRWVSAVTPWFRTFVPTKTWDRYWETKSLQAALEAVENSLLALLIFVWRILRRWKLTSKLVKFNCAACLSTATICFETTVHSDVGLVPFATDVGHLATYFRWTRKCFFYLMNINLKLLPITLKLCSHYLHVLAILILTGHLQYMPGHVLFLCYH